jgi:hypothetical protein
MSEGKIRRHFLLPTKLHILLLDADVVTRLHRLLVDKSGNNVKSANPLEIPWIIG